MFRKQLLTTLMAAGLGCGLIAGCESTPTVETTNPKSTAPASMETVVENKDGETYVFYKGSEAHKHFMAHGTIEKPIVGLVGGIRIYGESDAALDAYLEALADIEYVTIEKGDATYVFVSGSSAHEHYKAHGKIEKPITAHAGGMKLIAANERVIDGYLNSIPETPDTVVVKKNGDTYVFFENSENHQHFNAHGKIEKPIVGLVAGTRVIGESEAALDAYLEMLANIEYVTIEKGDKTYVFIKGSEAHQHFSAHGKLEKPITAIAGGTKLVAANEDVIDGYLNTQ